MRTVRAHLAASRVLDHTASVPLYLHPHPCHSAAATVNNPASCCKLSEVYGESEARAEAEVRCSAGTVTHPNTCDR